MELLFWKKKKNSKKPCVKEIPSCNGLRAMGTFMLWPMGF
jgi:hypothetical protein